jgi:hypothetical protein
VPEKTASIPAAVRNKYRIAYSKDTT